MSKHTSKGDTRRMTERAWAGGELAGWLALVVHKAKAIHHNRRRA